MAALALQLICAFQQTGGRLLQLWAALQPVDLGGGEIPEGWQAIKATVSVQAGLKPEHPEGLLQRPAQPAGAEVVGADKPVAVSTEHPNSRTHPEGRSHARDRVLLGQYSEMVGALQEHLHQIGTGSTTAGQQILQGCSPAMVEAAGVRRGGSDHAMAGGKGEALKGLMLRFS